MNFQAAISNFLSAAEEELEKLSDAKDKLEEKDKLTEAQEERLNDIVDRIDNIETAIAYVEGLNDD